MQDTLVLIVKHSQWAADRLFAVASTLTDDQYCRRVGGELGSVQVLVAQIGREAHVCRTRLEGSPATATQAAYHRGQLANMLRLLDRTTPAVHLLAWLLDQQKTDEPVA